MKKTISALIAIMLCVAMTASFAGCTSTASDDEAASDVFVAATIETADGLPSSEAEIIAFYNNIISSVQADDTFTAANKPGVKTNESLGVGNIKVLAYDKATDTATESDALSALNDSAKAIKDRILSGIDTSIPVIPFGDINTSISSVIYPYDSAESKLDADDVVSAECSADGNNVNISIVLGNDIETVNTVFGTRDKAEVLADMNKNCENYATINDYSVEYVFVDTEEEKTYSTINLSVELEKQADGTYECTGRITSFSIKMIADVKANITCKGSFEDAGDVQVQFRLTDEKSYEFDWLGTADWEPVKEAE